VTTEEVPDALADERIDRIVSMVTGMSRSEATSLIAAGRVAVNGVAVVSRSHRVDAGDVIEIDAEPVRATAPVTGPDESVPARVVYEDADLLVVDKEPDVVVHPGSGNQRGTLVQGLLARYPELAGVGPDPIRPGVVHRLDKETSGLLVFARSEAAYTGLVTMLAAHEVDRRYLALVWGRFSTAAGMVDAPIGRSAREPTRMTVSTRGKEARTRYEVLHAYREPVEVTLLRCQLETGRTHQIRVHLRAIDHPVVGDARYGGQRQSLSVPRLFLHASSLSFDHPVTGVTMAFEAQLPADLQVVLDRLGEAPD
jgi:23S rRNA pseudouridine1911/1915/1917 synthase